MVIKNNFTILYKLDESSRKLVVAYRIGRRRRRLVSALHFGDLLTMLNVNKSMGEDEYSAAAFRKGFFIGCELAEHRGESGVTGGRYIE